MGGYANGLHTGISTILDRFRDPLFLISPDRRLLWCNAPADRVLHSGSGLGERGGHLVLATATANEALDRILGDVSAATSVGHACARGLQIMRSTTHTWLALLRPLFVQRISDEQAILLQLVARARPCTAPTTALRDLFALSQRECDVAVAMLRTGSLAEGSTLLHISRETARSHLKQVFRKCGVHSQEQLVTLLNNLCQFEK